MPVLRIVETPVGQKKLRYRVSEADLGVDEINTVSERVQARLLEMLASLPKLIFQRDAPRRLEAVNANTRPHYSYSSVPLPAPFREADNPGGRVNIGGPGTVGYAISCVIPRILGSLKKLKPPRANS